LKFNKIGRLTCKPSSVMMVIHLAWQLPARSSVQTRGKDGPPSFPSIWTYSRWGLPGSSVTWAPVSSYLTISPLPGNPAVSFLWHFPGSCLHWVLPSTLPWGARTFLDCLKDSRDHPISLPCY